MMKEIHSIIDLVEKFPTDKSCMEYLESIRWKNGVVSPFEAKSKVYKCSNGRYKCRSSNRYFDVRTGTLFEDTKLSLRKWFIAIFYVTVHKKGISSCQLARDINVTQKTAWFILKRIHNCLGIDCVECLKNMVEVDETYIGGKNKNRHNSKKVEHAQGRSTKDKTPVFGMIERGGLVVAKVVGDTKRDSLLPIIQKSIDCSATIYSDEWQAYVTLSNMYDHEVVNHGAGQYVSGDAHTNTMENYWSHLKRMILGIHHHVSARHLQYYVDSQAFRHNTREISDSHRFSVFLQNTENRLTYNKLIKCNDQTNNDRHGLHDQNQEENQSVLLRHS